MLSQIIQRSWYRSFGVVTLLLLPLSVLYCLIVFVRRTLYKAGIFRQTKLPVPVIIVGNLSVGGTGKTPLVIAITKYLKSKGYKPGVVSRGYGGQSNDWPQLVTDESNPVEVGDESVLIAERCQCPVSVGPDRVKAAESLLKKFQCNIIVSDDGLQHLALQRDIEIIVIDGERRFGNSLCLPAGPMRELASRVKKADVVVSNGAARPEEHEMQLVGDVFQHISSSSKSLTANELKDTKVHAVAGIGNNDRFFNALDEKNIDVIKHSFPDHFAYTAKDFEFSDELPVVMTEKDAVKCKQFAINNAWFLKVDAILKDNFFQKIDGLLDSVNNKLENENG